MDSGLARRCCQAARPRACRCLVTQRVPITDLPVPTAAQFTPICEPRPGRFCLLKRSVAVMKAPQWTTHTRSAGSWTLHTLHTLQHSTIRTVFSVLLLSLIHI